MSGQDPVEVTVDIAIEGCQGAEVPPHPRTRITQKVKTSTRFTEQQDRGSRGAHRAPGRSQVPRIAPTNGHAACAARTPSTLSQFLFTFIDYFLIVSCVDLMTPCRASAAMPIGSGRESGGVYSIVVRAAVTSPIYAYACPSFS